MNFRIPRETMTPVDDVDVRLVHTPHPYEMRNMADIEANWQVEHQQNPALFDGTMVLLSSLAIDAGRAVGVCHPVRYATMLYWRKRKGDHDIEHSFAFPAIVTRDNALLAVRMAKHTANPGMVYFAAGSFEPSDFIGDQVDIEGNMRREVTEETGLDLAIARHEDQYHIYSVNYSTVIFRRYWFDEDAETLAQKVWKHIAGEEQSEIDEPVIIRAGDPIPQGASRHMAEIVNWHFGR